MFCLHHLNESRSQRIVWLLELLDLEYEIKVYKRDATTNLAPDSLKKIHSLGTAPLLTFEDDVVAESGAICEYLVLKAGDTHLIPSKDSSDYIDVQFWSHYSEGSFLPPLVTSMVLNKGKEKASPFFIKFVIGKFVDAVMAAYFGKAIARNLAFIEMHLHNRSWLVGENITVADVQMSFPLEAMYKAGKLKLFPNITAYVERFQNEPSYQKALTQMSAAEKAVGNAN
jgi:glutathione S-transferase